MSTANFDTFDAVGNREDLTEEIYDISPTETPFMNGVGRGTAKSTLHEWQTDSLASASTSNARIQGADAGSTNTAATTRLTNRTQISDKVVRVSGTQEIVDKAGRDSEMAYQEMQRLRELKRDMEAILTANQAVVVGDSATASKIRSLTAWYSTNVSAGAGGGNGTTTLARTDGTQRALTETLVLNLHEDIFIAGGDPTMAMCGPFNKRAISAFAGGASRTIDAEGRRLIQAVDVYESDFGTLQVVPNRFQRERDLHILDPEFWAVAYLRSPFSQPLSKTGDADNKQILVEYTLEARNQAASGLVADLTTS